MAEKTTPRKVLGTTRRKLLWGVGAGGLGAAALAMTLLRRRIIGRLSLWTRLPDFAATPPLVPHDEGDRRRLYVSQGKTPAENIDAVLEKLGGVEELIGEDDVVIVKVSAQWWNIGMTNVAAVKRMLERLVGRAGFRGEVIVFENTHFRLADGSGLSRAWTHPSERNVDVPGWDKMGDLVRHFAAEPVSFVGLVDAGPSSLAGDHWHDHGHEHGVYGGDGRGPIAPGEDRDGYHWDFERTFRLRRSWVDDAQTPLTWPRFTSPRTGVVVDLRDGLFERKDGALHPIAGRKLTFINMTTANEHSSTGLTCCCKSAMGIVDMSAGRHGTDPRVRDYQSVHYFGEPSASWRMAGPLAQFAREVRSPDLYVACAEYVGAVPAEGLAGAEPDLRIEAASAHQVKTVVAGSDPVAIDTWVARNLLMPIGGKNRASYDLDDEGSRLSKFLRYYRQVNESGTLDPALIEIV